jgi:hypothetical protein
MDSTRYPPAGSPSTAPRRKKRLGRLAFFILLPLVALGLLLAGCTSAPPRRGVPQGLLVPEDFSAAVAEEENSGTWLVVETNLSIVYPKIVIHSWGLVEQFDSPASESYAWRNTSATVQKWQDASGNVWCKNYARFSMKGFYSGQAFYLTRLSSDRQTLETIFGNLGWPDPAEMDPESNTTYVRYQRLE